MRKWRKWKLLGTVGCLFLFGLGAYRWGSSQPLFFSDPDAAGRPLKDWAWDQFATDTYVGPKAVPISEEEFFKTHTFTYEDDGDLRLTIPQANWYRAFPPYEILDLSDPAEEPRLVEMDALAITWMTPEDKLLRYGYESQFRHYGSAGDLIEDPADPRISLLSPGLTRVFRPSYCPTLALQFRHDLPSLELQHFHLFDTRSQARVGSRFHGPIKKVRPNAFAGESRLLTWKRKEILAAVDLAYGRRTSHVIQPVAGAECSHNGITCRLLHLEPRELLEGGSRNTTTDPVKFEIKFGPATDKCALVFSAYPYRVSSGISFKVFNQEGKVIQAREMGRFHELYILSCDAPLAEVSRIEVSFRPHFLRVLCPLDDLPGLPRENDRLDNLFAMKVPYAVMNPVDYDLACGGLAQYTVFNNGLLLESYAKATTAEYVVYEDTTVDKMLRDHLRMSQPGTVMVDDPLEMEIRFQERSGTWRDKVLGWWQKVTPF